MKNVQEKLSAIASELGFPFAINAHGYDHENDQYNGLQAWSCDEDEQDRASGVRIVVFVDESDIENYDANVRLFHSVESAAFFVTEDGLTKF